MLPEAPSLPGARELSHGKTLLDLLLLGPGVQVGNEFTASFHLHQGYTAHMPPHALKSRFSVEFPRMQEAKELNHPISVSLL